MKTISTIIIFTLAVCGTATAGVSILNGLSHVYNAKKGSTIRGEVVLYNSTPSFQRVVFELNEALFACNQNRKFVSDTTHDRSASSWFSCKVNEAEIAPNSKYTVPFSFDIPEDGILEGSFWTALMVSIDQPIRSERLNNNIGLNTKMRYAVALIVNINKNENLLVDFKDVQLSKEETSQQEVLVQLKNDGEYANPVQVTLELFDESGKKVGVFTSKNHLIFPKVCRQFQIPVAGLPKGKYTGVLLAQSGKQYVGSNIHLLLK